MQRNSPQQIAVLATYSDGRTEDVTVEFERGRPVVLLGWETADKLFRGRNPIDQKVKINGVHFRVVGVSEKKGAFFGNSQDTFVVIPLGATSLVSTTSGTTASASSPGITPHLSIRDGSLRDVTGSVSLEGGHP